jgi:hypothetical protein
VGLRFAGEEKCETLLMTVYKWIESTFVLRDTTMIKSVESKKEGTMMLIVPVQIITRYINRGSAKGTRQCKA